MTQKHTIPQSILFHLIPGIFIAVANFLFYFVVTIHSLPNEVGNLLSAVFVLCPLELGILLYLSKRNIGTYHFLSLIPWKEKANLKEYFIFILVMAIWAILISILFDPFEIFVRDTVFSFVPTKLVLGKYDVLDFPKSTMVFIGIFGIIANGLMAPIVEELYFRGYLLPRINLSMKKAVCFNAALFSLYHFFAPWGFLSRFLMMVPLYYWVAKRKNIRFSIIAHIIANSYTMIVMLITVLR